MVYVYYTRYLINEDEHKYKKEHQIGLSLLCYALRKKRHLSISEQELSKIYTYGEYGKPYLKGYENLHFSISHCDEWVACAVSDRPVGIDVERTGYLSDLMIKRMLTKEEQGFLNQYRSQRERYLHTFYCFWTLKESYLKWNGRGFSMDPKKIAFSLDCDGGEKIRCSDSSVSCRQIMIGTDCILSICYEGKEEEIYYESYKKKMAGSDCKLPD